MAFLLFVKIDESPFLVTVKDSMVFFSGLTSDLFDLLKVFF